MKTKLAIFILVLVAVLVATAPVSAEPQPHLVGDQISVSVSTQEFPASKPFHIRHGWTSTPGGGNSEEDKGEKTCKDAWDFLLTHSHPPTVPVGDCKDRPYTEVDLSTHPPQQLWQHLYEFKDGAGPGVVTFTGTWYAPCWAAVAAGWLPGPCDSDCASVEVFSRTTEVTFFVE